MSASRFERAANTFGEILFLGNNSESGSTYFTTKKRTLSEVELGSDPNKERRRSFSEDLANGTEIKKVVKLKQAVKHIFKLLEFLMERLDQKGGLVTEEIQMLFSRIEMIQSDIGTRSTDRTDKLEVPTIWGSVALLSCTIEELVHDDGKKGPALTDWKPLLMKEIERIENSAVVTVNNIEIDLRTRIAEMLKDSIQDATKRDIEITHVNSRLGSLHRDIQNVGGDVQTLGGAVHKLEAEVQVFDTKNDAVLVKIVEGLAVVKGELEDVRVDLRSTGFRSASLPASSNCSNYVPLPLYHSKVFDLDNRMLLMQDR